MTSQVAQDLRAAAEVLKRDGWTQGAYGNRQSGYCLVGVLDRVAVEHRISDTAEERMYRLLHEAIGTERDIAWNDAQGRTVAEVIAALEAAADAAEAQP